MEQLIEAFEESFKNFAEFICATEVTRRKLHNADRTALLKSYAGEHFVLEIARRSQRLRGFRRLDVLELDSEFAYIRNDEDICATRMGGFLEELNKLVVCFSNFKATCEDYAYLRAISFFNPSKLHSLSYVRFFWRTKQRDFCRVTCIIRVFGSYNSNNQHLPFKGHPVSKTKSS